MTVRELLFLLAGACVGAAAGLTAAILTSARRLDHAAREALRWRDAHDALRRAHKRPPRG